MAIGSKVQLKSLNLDPFSINLESNKIEFVNKAKYLGLLVKDDLTWDDHILQLCKTMNYCVHVLCQLNKIFPKLLLLKIHKSDVQSQLDYGLSIRDVPLKEIWIVYKECRIYVLGLYIKIMIILTQEE